MCRVIQYMLFGYCHAIVIRCINIMQTCICTLVIPLSQVNYCVHVTFSWIYAVFVCDFMHITKFIYLNFKQLMVLEQLSLLWVFFFFCIYIFLVWLYLKIFICFVYNVFFTDNKCRKYLILLNNNGTN